MTRIEGKVAKIIDVYTVVINRGLKHGVEEDMRFVIYEPGEEIKDPDGGSLGIFEYVKAKVEVTNVSEKFSTAKTYETHTMTMPALQEAIVRVTGQTMRNELPLDEETSARLQKGLPSVKIGDLVRQILD